MGLDAFNWMQRYAGSEMIELADEGRIDRRELMRRLAGICGSAAAATHSSPPAPATTRQRAPRSPSR